jgi:hypothetical protein
MVALGPVTRRAVRQTRYERARPASLQDQLGAVAKAVGALKPSACGLIHVGAVYKK